MTPTDAVFREIFEICKGVGPTFDYLPDSNQQLPFVFVGESMNSVQQNSDLFGRVTQTLHVYGKRIQRKQVNESMVKIHDQLLDLEGKHGYSIQLTNYFEQLIPDNSDTVPLLHGIIDLTITYTKKGI